MIGYEPAESRSGLFGGNSNWRGPVWFPVNFLLIEALQKFHWYYGDAFVVECPSGSGNSANLWQVSQDLGSRLCSLFLPGADGRRPADPDGSGFEAERISPGPVLFHEYFDGDTGAGLGASHQTGWTALVAKLLEQSARFDPARIQPPPTTPTAKKEHPNDF